MEGSTVDNVASNQPVGKLVANDRQKFICDICSSKFAFKSSLKKHIKNKHERNTANVTNQPYQCQYCIRRYSHKASLYKHLKKNHLDQTLKLEKLVADDRRRFTCEICLSKFAFRSSLNKHLRNKHERNTANGAEDQLIYQCQYCIRKYSHKVFLYKHLEKSHVNQPSSPEKLVADDRRKFTCKICPSKFTFRSSLSKHFKNKHNKGNRANFSQRYQCQYCIRKYSHKSTLYKHLKLKHLHQTVKPNSKSVNCHNCYKTYTTKYVLKKHIQNEHPLFSGNDSHKKTYSCCICEFSCSKFGELVTHYLDHEIKIKIANHTFENYEKFLFWKENEEKTCYVRYIKKCGTKTGLNGVKRDLFQCHRSGVFKSNSKGLRNLKSQGSRKIGKKCPSRMLVKTTQGGKVFVKYIITHVGHELDLRHLNLTTAEKKTIANKIASRVPFENILDDVRNSVCDENGIRRLHLITRQDLRNIEKNTRNEHYQLECKEELDESNIFLKDDVDLPQSDMSLVDDVSVDNFQQEKQNYLQDLTEYIEKNINTPEELALIKKITLPILDQS